MTHTGINGQTCNGRWPDAYTELDCPHCGSKRVDFGATGLDMCWDCDGLFRRGVTSQFETAKENLQKIYREMTDALR